MVAKPGVEQTHGLNRARFPGDQDGNPWQWILNNPGLPRKGSLFSVILYTSIFNSSSIKYRLPCTLNFSG